MLAAKHRQALEAPFAEAGTLHELEHGGTRFRYRRCGRGPDTLLILPGALGGGELLARLAEALEGSHRVLLLTYPRVTTVEALLGGITAILDAEGVGRCAAMGGSFGGAPAQCLVRRHPERVSKMVLSGTLPPEASRAVANRRFLRLLPFLPMTLLRALLRGVVRLLLRKAPERRSLLAYYRGQIAGLRREELRSRYQIAIDYDESWSFAPEDLAAWGGEVLILEGSADRFAGKAGRERLRALYPGAARHAFEGAGHGASALRPEAFRSVVTRFLREGAAAVA